MCRSQRSPLAPLKKGGTGFIQSPPFEGGFRGIVAFATNRGRFGRDYALHPRILNDRHHALNRSGNTRRIHEQHLAALALADRFTHVHVAQSHQ
jgi:hypothetical protein